MSAPLAVDVLLGLILVGLAAQVAIGEHLFRAIVFYVAFGLSMSVIWARLGAPDLALADAAIGAGLTGALMMVAFRRLVEIDPKQAQAQGTRSSALAVLIGVLAAGMVATIGLTALTLEQQPGRAGLQVMETLGDTGLGNPITGVLLVFRGFDTLIEMTVLLTAFVGSRVMTTRSRFYVATIAGFQLPLVRTLVAVILPLAALIAMHLLWIGSDQPGGAFQGGTVLAAVGLVAAMAGLVRPPRIAAHRWRVALVAGPSVFLVAGLAGAVLGAGFLTLPEPVAGTAIFVIEVGLAISIAVTLVFLVLGPPEGERRE